MHQVLVDTIELYKNGTWKLADEETETDITDLSGEEEEDEENWEDTDSECHHIFDIVAHFPY